MVPHHRIIPSSITSSNSMHRTTNTTRITITTYHIPRPGIALQQQRPPQRQQPA